MSFVRGTLIQSLNSKDYVAEVNSEGKKPFNMVDGFLPLKGVVESFYVPYYSDDTSEEKHILFTYGKEFNEEGMNYPTNVQDSKKQPMEIDVIENKYFRFLQKKAHTA